MTGTTSTPLANPNLHESYSPSIKMTMKHTSRHLPLRGEAPPRRLGGRTKRPLSGRGRSMSGKSSLRLTFSKNWISRSPTDELVFWLSRLEVSKSFGARNCIRLREGRTGRGRLWYREIRRARVRRSIGTMRQLSWRRRSLMMKVGLHMNCPGCGMKSSWFLQNVL